MVQTRSFRRTVPLLSSGDQTEFGEANDAVDAECNAFLATLDSVDVLDVGKIVTPIGKGGILAYVERWVTFKA